MSGPISLGARIGAEPSLRISRIPYGYTRWSRRPINKPPHDAEIAALFEEPVWSVKSLLPPLLRSDSSNDALVHDLEKNTNITKEKESTDAAVADQDTLPQPKPATTNIFKRPKPIVTSEPVSDPEEQLTVESIRRLLRLSALQNVDREKRRKLLQDIRNHLHFVRAIQAVDTTGVQPLVTLRDESRFEVGRTTIDNIDLEPYLLLEKEVGFNGGIRRRWKVDMEGEAGEEEKASWGVDLKDLGDGSEQRLKGRYLFVKKDKNAKEQVDADVDQKQVAEKETRKKKGADVKDVDG